MAFHPQSVLRNLRIGFAAWCVASSLVGLPSHAQGLDAAGFVLRGLISGDSDPAGAQAER
jgi:hypothetical protein